MTTTVPCATCRYYQPPRTCAAPPCATETTEWLTGRTSSTYPSIDFARTVGLCGVAATLWEAPPPITSLPKDLMP